MLNTRTYSKLLKKLRHQLLTKPQHSPILGPTITHGSKLQQAIKDDNSLVLDKDSNSLGRSIVGAALFISRFIDMTLLVGCNKIALPQTDATIATMNVCTQLLDYVSVHPDPSIRFKKSDYCGYYLIAATNLHLNHEAESEGITCWEIY